MTELTSIGHASFRLTTPAGTIVYVDAWLQKNPFCPSELKIPERADLFLVTHGHGDHLDPDLPSIAEALGATVIGPPAVRMFLHDQGVKRLEGIGKGGTIRFNDLSITLTDALHPSHIGTEEKAGYPHEASGFVLRAEGMPTIYFAGDTGIFPGMELIGKMYQPEVAVLPIGDRFTMGPYEASWATRLIGCRRVVPMHYGTFPFLTGTAEELREYLADDAVSVVEIAAGQSSVL